MASLIITIVAAIITFVAWLDARRLNNKSSKTLDDIDTKTKELTTRTIKIESVVEEIGHKVGADIFIAVKKGLTEAKDLPATLTSKLARDASVTAQVATVSAMNQYFFSGYETSSGGVDSFAR